MRYKLLGKSGLRVSELALGTMTFGTEWGWGSTRKESQEVFDAYANAGGNFIDTANRYTNGTSEAFVGDFVASDRDHFVVATKYTLFDREGDPNFAGNHRKNLVRSLEASLKRLKMDTIDLLWVHAWDNLTPVEEVLRALDDLVSAGKVHYIGISDAPAWVVSRANTMADANVWSRFVALQVKYSLLDRDVEREHLPMAAQLDLAVTPWGVLASGVLTGKYNSDGSETNGRASLRGAIDDQKLAVAASVIDVANEVGCSPSQVALNWVRQQQGVIIPLIGARTVAQLKDNLGCLEYELTPSQIDHLNEVTGFQRGFPYDFLESQYIRSLVYGKTFEQIDNHRL